MPREHLIGAYGMFWDRNEVSWRSGSGLTCRRGTQLGMPDLFFDRSLGRVQVPRILRASGLRLHTLAEVDGLPRPAWDRCRLVSSRGPTRMACLNEGRTYSVPR
jgi:hypothetical protein